jgi:hypothetical protein
MFFDLKNTDDNTKSKIALVGATIISLVIVFVWVHQNFSETKEEIFTTQEQGTRFFAAVGENFKKSTNEIGALFAELKSVASVVSSRDEQQSQKEDVLMLNNNEENKKFDTIGETERKTDITSAIHQDELLDFSIRN